jgi:hypothetical protein
VKKFGYHRLVLSTGEVIEGPLVITVDSALRLREWHFLYGEEAMVEWVGGAYDCRME